MSARASQGIGIGGAPTSPGRNIVMAAEGLLRSRPILAQSYFTRLQDGRMGLAEFSKTQQQFYFAVRFFSRPIAALVARCPDSSTRMDLVHNLAEEQGEFTPPQAHDRTFLRFLSSIGVSSKATALAPERAAVCAFNYALMGACQNADLNLAFGCLGMIEHAFADISALLGRSVVMRGWVSEHDLVHYNLHAAIDKRHAEEFFAVVEPAWQSDPRKQASIHQGLAFGHHIFGRLYEDLEREAE